MISAAMAKTNEMSVATVTIDCSSPEGLGSNPGLGDFFVGKASSAFYSVRKY